MIRKHLTKQSTINNDKQLANSNLETLKPIFKCLNRVFSGKTITGVLFKGYDYLCSKSMSQK